MGNDALYRSEKGIAIQFGTEIAHVFACNDVERWNEAVERETKEKLRKIRKFIEASRSKDSTKCRP